MPKRARRGLLAFGLSTILLIVSWSLPDRIPFAGAVDLSQSLKETGQKVAGAIKHGLQHTRDYLQSKQFHQDASRFAQDAGIAVKNAGNWLGKQLDNAKK